VLGGVVLSARAAGRPFVLALVMGALRLFLAPRVPFLGSRADDWRRRRDRVFRPDADAVTTSISWRSSLVVAAGLCVVTVILLFPPRAVEWQASLAAGRVLRMGERIGTLRAWP